MYGFQAITANNGWAIAFVGLTIVFSGLVILAMSISRLHLILQAWDNRADLIDFIKEMKLFRGKSIPVPVPDEIHEYNLQASMEQCELLVDSIGRRSFKLPRLLELAEQRGVDRPHATIHNLLKQNIITPDGDGFYSWTSSVIKKGS